MTVMCHKITNIVAELASSLHMSELQATELFYSTSTYKELISQQTYLWTESSSFIADESLRELGLYDKH